MSSYDTVRGYKRNKIGVSRGIFAASAAGVFAASVKGQKRTYLCRGKLCSSKLQTCLKSPVCLIKQVSNYANKHIFVKYVINPEGFDYDLFLLEFNSSNYRMNL